MHITNQEHHEIYLDVPRSLLIEQWATMAVRMIAGLAVSVGMPMFGFMTVVVVVRMIVCIPVTVGVTRLDLMTVAMLIVHFLVRDAIWCLTDCDLHQTLGHARLEKDV